MGKSEGTNLLDTLADPTTDRRLLPGSFWPRDNGRRLHHCRIAIKKAINDCITSDQRQAIELYYGQGMRKTDIARLQKKGVSAITKSLRAGQRSICGYTRMYMEIYDALEKEMLSDDQ